jgi:hypothetical protein
MPVVQDQNTNEQQMLLAQLTALTAEGKLRWERQARSAHRYARWNSNLLILGPTAPLDDQRVPRYLFITPLSSPTGVEITSEDVDTRAALLSLVYAVEAATANQPARDPFALNEQALSSAE